MDLPQLFEQYIQYGVYLRGWSPKTVAIYRRALANFQTAVGDTPIADVTKGRLETWVAWMRNQKRSATYINIHIRALNAFLHWAHDEEHVPKRLFLKQVPNPQKLVHPISDKEVSQILALRPSFRNAFRTWALIHLLLDTGCRIDEVLSLKLANVDLENLLVTVRGKGNKIRRVPLSTECRKVLFRYRQTVLKKGTVSEFFFCSRYGSALTYRNTYRDIKNLCQKAGVEGEHVHPHAFRHKFAVSYIRNGGDIYRLSRILGHTSISTTQIYLRSMGVEQIAEGHSQLSPLARRA